MKKTTDKLVAIILSVAVMLSTVVISGVLSTSAEDTSTVTVLPDDAPASELLSETKIFTFDKVKEFAVNKDYGIDQEGNVFYPLHSANNNATVKQKNFVVDGETVTTAEVSANGVTVYIPTDENGQPFIVEPNTRYDVKIRYYNMAAHKEGQFWAGAGTLSSNQAAYDSDMNKNFYLWQFHGDGHRNTKWVNTKGYNPFYRCEGENWADTNRYNPTVSFKTVSKKIETLDFTTNGGMFQQSTYNGTSYNDDSHDFGKYFAITFSANNVQYDGANGTYSGKTVYYIDSIEITANRSRTLEVGESYTFNFNEGEVVATGASTKLTDGDGNTFYPYHSEQTGDSFTQANIDVTLKDGTVQTKSALRYETKGGGYRQYIPTDKNGKPFVFDPNSKYELIVEGYIEKAGGHSQVFFGGGAFHSDQAAYAVLDSSYNGEDAWYFIDGTDATKDSGAMVSGYPIYRASSFFWDDIARSFTGFTQNNGDPAQYSKYTMNFTTKDFEEIDNTNHFKEELWQRNQFINADGTYPDPYTTEGVTIKTESIGQYFSITCGSADSIFYIDYITITKVSTTDTAEITFDANGGTFAEGTTLSADLTIGGDFSSVTAPTNADTTLSFAGWSTHREGDPVSKVTSAMKGKTLYAIWKPAVANVTFDANGGKLADGSATKVTTQYKDLKFTEANPTRAGYIFMGWALSKDATTPVTVTTADMAGKTLYALWKADPISVTFNANGGKFADGTITKIANQVTGIAPSFEAPIRSIDKFVGWSLSADSSTVVSTITKEMAGTTLYAVYEESHPANGVYDSWSRTVEFDKYVVSPNVNTFVPTGEKYGENSGVPYFKVIDDPDQPGDKLLHFYNHSKASNWYANWCLTPTYNGVSGTTAGQEDYNVLPTDSTFKVTLRVHVKNVGNAATFAMYYGANNGRQSTSDQKNTAGYKDLINSITETDGFVIMETYFTTPAEYTVTEKGVANRLYMGFTEQETNLEYDLDYIKIEKVTSVNLYAKVDGKTTLMETLIGQPGSAMNLPEIYSDESYDLYSPVGTVTNKAYGNWFNDEACTEEANLKFGNFNYNLYCNDFRDLPSVSTENQEILVGFDTYTQRTNGLYNAEIVKSGANSGKASLKANVAGKAGFELKNDMVLDLTEGKTYRADFVYKSDAELTFAIGYSNGEIMNGVNALATKKLAAADDWTAASVVFTANGITDASVLAAKVTAENATAYFDTFIISSVTESVGVEAESTANGEALRFMLTYNGTDEDTVVMAGKEFTVTEHGVLVKAEELDTALNLENKNANGIFHFAETDMTKNWSVNPVTGDTVYSAYLNGFDKNDDYKVSVRGYVKLADGTVFYTDTLTASVTDIPAAGELIPENADLNDFYVYLPAGTTFPADRNYTITTYDDFFAANNAEKNNTLTENSYVKFSARPDVAEINVPSEGKYLVHTGTKEELFYGVNYQVVTNDLNTVADGNVGYIFITDIHFGSSLTNTAGKSVIRQTELITKMANENDNIDFVVVAGDTTTGMYGSKEAAIQWTQAGLDPLLNCTKPVFVLMGNHDDNSYHIASGNKVLKPELVFSDLDWQNNIINRYTNKGNITVVQDDPAKRQNSKYYYYDLEGKKTRVIALDAIDYEAKYDENGVILGDLDGDGFFDGFPTRTTDATASDTAKYYNGYTYWGYSADQLRWLAEDALGTLPDGYEVIFVSHMGIDKDTNCYGSKIWFGDEIRDVIETFNAGGTYSGNFTDIWGNTVSVNADFSDINGEIAIWQFGHMHVEGSIYSEDINLWQICTSTCNVGNAGTQTTEQLQSGSINNKNLPWRVYARRYGDETEICFNVMSVSSERIYRYTIGQGANEKLVYPN